MFRVWGGVPAHTVPSQGDPVLTAISPGATHVCYFHAASCGDVTGGGVELEMVTTPPRSLLRPGDGPERGAAACVSSVFVEGETKKRNRKGKHAFP